MYVTMLITILIMTGPLLLHVNVCWFANCCESGYFCRNISGKFLQYQYNTSLAKNTVYLLTASLYNNFAAPVHSSSAYLSIVCTQLLIVSTSYQCSAQTTVKCFLFSCCVDCFILCPAECIVIIKVGCKFSGNLVLGGNLRKFFPVILNITS